MIREVTLPMFYEMNTFRFNFCYESQQDAHAAMEYLDRVGGHQRHTMRKMYLYDADPTHAGDDQSGTSTARRKMERTFGATVELLESDSHCYLHVSFPSPEEEYEGLWQLFEE